MNQPPPTRARPGGFRCQQTAFPALDRCDPRWGTLNGPGWSIESNIGREDPIDSIMLHGRGDDDVADVVRQAARVLGCRALDCSSSEFIEDGGRDGWANFQAFRDGVLGSVADPA